MNNFQQAMEKRRSIYALTNESTLNDQDLIELLEYATKYVPSAFNSQSAKVVLLLNDQHLKFWDIVKQTLKKVVPEEQFASTEAKMASFAAAHGTILFFDDTKITDGFKETFDFYKDNFTGWAQQANAMLQYAIWTSLGDVDMGASLQHYNPIIDEEVKQVFGLSDSYQLIAQMPFGKIAKNAEEKEFNDIKDRVRVMK